MSSPPLKFYKWKGWWREGRSNSWWETHSLSWQWLYEVPILTPSSALRGSISANRQNSHLIRELSPLKGNLQRQGMNNYSHAHPELWLKQTTQGVPDTFVSLRSMNNHIKDIWQDKGISTVLLLMCNTRYSSWLEIPKYPCSLFLLHHFISIKL